MANIADAPNLAYDQPPKYQQQSEHGPSLNPNDPNSVVNQFGSMRLSDPVPRGTSTMTNRDPIQRLGTSMSVGSAHHPHPQPRHQNTMPLMTNRQPRPSNSADYQYQGDPGYSRNSSGSQHQHQNGYVHINGSYDPSLDGDRSSYHSFDDQSVNGSAANHGPYPPRGSSQQAWQSQTHLAASHGHSGAHNNYLYAAASDVLGMAPPPSGPSAPYPPSTYPAQNTMAPSSLGTSMGPVPGPSAFHPGSSMSPFPAIASSAASLMSKGDSTSSGASTIHPDDDEFHLRPLMSRSGTSFGLQTRKTKAVDLTAPPYTKDYIDQYRQRIKADPDPEAHFLYAKYLIDAAKKIGADAKDQRTVKKYRDMLITESLKVIRRLATQGEAFAEAQFFLANCYGTGMLGLQVDHERAYHLYLQAAKQNHSAASYRVAVCNEIGAGTRREPPRAAAFYRKAASLGDTAAMYKLGMILLHGTLGEMKNPREAINWLKRAAEQADEENPHALHELGLLHELPNSQLVPHDPGYAKYLFMQAAHLGYTQSQYKLGQCFEYGALTCPVDPRRSIAWYTKAAEKGDSEAELALSGWYLTGSEGVLKQSDSEAYLWARRAANKGLNKAEYAVGYYAEVGIGIKQDIEFAKRWYMRAAGTYLLLTLFDGLCLRKF